MFVYGKGFDVYILQLFGNFFNVFGIVILIQVGFYCDGQVGGFDDIIGELDYMVNILQNVGVCYFVDYFFYGVIEVDIQYFWLGFFYDFCCLYYGIVFCFENLNVDWVFIIVNVEFLYVFVCVVD